MLIGYKRLDSSSDLDSVYEYRSGSIFSEVAVSLTACASAAEAEFRSPY